MADPTTWTDVVLLLHADGSNGATSTVDSSSFDNTVSLGFNALSTAQKKFGTASISFSGGGSGPISGNSADVVTLGSSFTQEGFFYWSSLANRTLWQWGVFNAVSVNATGDQFTLNTLAGGGVASSVVSPLSLNAWHHLALVNNAGTAKLYLDGAAILSVAATFSNSSNTFQIGAGAGTSAAIDGFIDEVRWTANEALYTAPFTPPTQAFPQISSAVGSASGTGAATGVGRSTKTGTGSASGTATASATGRSTAVSIGAAAGAGGASAVGLSTALSVGSSTGTSTAAAVGASNAAGDGSASGTSSASATGASTYTATGSADGTAQATGASLALSISAGSAAGVGAALGVGIGPVVGFSVGIGAALGVGQSNVLSVGLASGIGSAAGFWRMDAVFPSTIFPVHFGTPIGPNNDAVKVTRTINAARFGYPTAFWIDIS